MTKFRDLLAAPALLLALPACAQTPAATQDADPALWVVKDQDTTIYLFGTIHVLKPGLTWFDEAVKTAFDRSDQVMLEMVAPEPAAMQALVMAKGIAPAGTPPLTEQVPADKRDAVTAAITGLGIPQASFDRMRPWFAASTLSVLPLMKMGYDLSSGPETIIAAAAKAAGKPVAGLETADQQLGYFAALSPAAQMTFLTSTVDELPDMGKTMNQMVGDWAKGDPGALAAEMNDELKDSPEVEKALLTDRNQRWAQWIKARMAKPGTVFIAVGAGHLAGTHSVQVDLKQLGLTATRIAY